MNLQQSHALVSLGIAGIKATGKLDPTILGFIETAEHARSARLLAAV